MIKTRARKIFGDVMSRRGRTILVSLSIMIGVFGVTALVGMGDLLVSQLEEDLDENAIAMTHIYMVSTSGQLSVEDNEDFMDLLRLLPGVTDVEGQAIYPTDWKAADASEDAKFEQGSLIAFTEAFEEVDLEPISRVVEGRYPVGGQNEIAIERRFADEHGMGIGDKITFRENPGDEWEVVGIVFQPYLTISPYITDVTNPGTPPDTNMYTTYEDAQQILDFAGLTSYYARYTDVDAAQAGLNHFTEIVATQTPYIPAFSYVEDPETNSLIEGAQQINTILNTLAVVALIVSAFLVVNVINTIVVEQKQQIGVLKSLGASYWDNFYIYCGMAFIYGVIGTIFGVLIAVPAASAMAQSIAPAMGTYIEDFRISTTGIITGVILGLLVPVLAAMLPVLNGVRVSILEAMTDLGISSNWGKSWLSRFIGGLPVPINVRQALSNIAQKRGRLALTGLTLTLAVGAYMGVTALFGTFDEAISNIFATFETEITMSTQDAGDFEEVKQLLDENFEDVVNVYQGYNVSVALEGFVAPENQSFAAGSNQIQASGLDPSSNGVEFDLIEGTGWEEDPTRRGIIINRTVAENIDKGAGDTVIVTIGGVSHEYEILGVDRFPFDTLFFNWEELATIAGYTDEDGNPTPSSFFIDLEGEPDADTTADFIDDVKAVMLENGIQAVYANQPQNEDDISQLISSFGLIFNMTSFVMAAVGAIGLLATLSMAVFERQKEIGVMRSLGAGSSTIIMQFLVEGVLVGVLAWVIGLPISYLLGDGLNNALDVGDIFPFRYSPVVAVQGLVGIIVIAAIASIWPSIAAARKTVSEILRYQ